MTLIIGLNLSDRIYLAADTRLTVEDKVSNKKYYTDNIFKIAPLVPPNLKSDVLLESKDRIYVAVAGDVELAKHIYSEINKLSKNGHVEYDIREIDKFLNKKRISEFVAKFVNKTGVDSDINCSIIFGGVSSSKTKTLPKEKLKELTDIHLRTVSRRKIKMHPLIPDLIEIDNIPLLPNHLFPFNLETGKKNDIVVADSLIFCLDICLIRGGEGFIFKKDYVEWGKFIARGASRTIQDSIPKGFLVECEFMKYRSDPAIAGVIAKQIRRFARKFTSIGGPIIIHAITQGSTFPLYDPNEVILKNGRVFLKDKFGHENERIPFWCYPAIKLNAEI